MSNPESIYPLFEATLKRIASLQQEDVNEADTRLQIVDEVLQLLGWPKSDFSPEEPTGLQIIPTTYFV